MNIPLPFINHYLSEQKRHNKDFLKKYQRIIVNYFKSREFREKNLLLLYMETGTGKTSTSLACAIEGFRAKMFNKIIILSPKSVQDEFIRNLNLYYVLTHGNDKDMIENNITMIAYNAFNAARQFLAIKELENSLIIIDEAHLFMKSIIKVQLTKKEKKKNDIGNAKRIYDKLLSLKNKKIICLTGTPSTKHPFETVPIFNLAGCNFPTSLDEFNNRYVDGSKIIRREELMNKLRGIVAYVKSDPSEQGLRVQPLKEILVEMSPEQYKQYLADYEKELNEKSFTNLKNVYGLTFGVKSSFHAKTFQDCVYWNPFIKNKERFIGEEKMIIDDKHCPKIIKMFDDSTAVNGLCVFYFKFVRMYGIDAMEQKLIKEGYKLATNDPFSSKGKRYVKFTGQIPMGLRNQWKRWFNDNKNKHGDYIKYLLLSPSGAVGLNLRNVRFLGIGSVEFNYSTIRQILGRANRLNSHIALPPEERTLVNNIYIMTKNNNYYKKHKKIIDKLCDRKAPNCNEVAPTIERCIYKDSLEDDILNEDFRKCLVMRFR